MIKIRKDGEDGFDGYFILDRKLLIQKLEILKKRISLSISNPESEIAICLLVSIISTCKTTRLPEKKVWLNDIEVAELSEIWKKYK